MDENTHRLMNQEPSTRLITLDTRVRGGQNTCTRYREKVKRSNHSAKIFDTMLPSMSRNTDESVDMHGHVEVHKRSMWRQKPMRCKIGVDSMLRYKADRPDQGEPLVVLSPNEASSSPHKAASRQW